MATTKTLSKSDLSKSKIMIEGYARSMSNLGDAALASYILDNYPHSIGFNRSKYSILSVIRRYRAGQKTGKQVAAATPANTVKATEPAKATKSASNDDSERSYSC